MEALILAVGAKTCCIIASGCGGLTNWAVKKKISWKDLFLACIVPVVEERLGSIIKKS